MTARQIIEAAVSAVAEATTPTTLAKLAKGFDYDTFLNKTDALGEPLLYRGGSLGNLSFMSDWIGHARQYGEDVDGVVIDWKDVLRFSDETFEGLRRAVAGIKGSDLLKIYSQFEDKLPNDARTCAKAALKFLKSGTPYKDVQMNPEINDVLVPIMVHYARQKGKNIIVFLGGDYGDYGGQDEFVVDVIGKYPKLSDIWKKANASQIIEAAVSVASDANYLKAVEAGDMEACQQMVDAVAFAAGYSVKAYHGTDKSFRIFKPGTGRALWFSEDKDKILSGEAGAQGRSKLMPVYLNPGRVSGWKEYENMVEFQLLRDFDSTKLDEDWIIYDPRRVKSALPVVKKHGKVVSLSMRFNMASKDIRESDSSHSDALRRTGFWGNQGAGCIFLAKSTGRILLQHRSRAVQEPGTWGTFGGAIDAGEEPEEAVRREVHEETGYTGSFELVPLAVFTSGSFRYSNFLAIVEDEFEPEHGWEAQGHGWFAYGDWPAPLHFGLRNLLGKSGAEIEGRCRKDPLSESKELFRAGQSPDDFDGKAPKVDWDAVDNYGHAWDEDTVEKFLNETPGWTYPAMVDASDLQPKLVEYDEAEQILKMSEQEFRENYPNLFVNEGENGEDEVYDWRALRDEEAESARSSWDGDGGGKQEMARAFGRGFPPAVVVRTGFDTYNVMDGNHRIDTWKEQGFDVIPVWVYDKYLRAAHSSFS